MRFTFLSRCEPSSCLAASSIDSRCQRNRGSLILSSDLPAIDIEIEKSKVRERCLELYPDREELYEMVYESRFQRLWEQFRGETEEVR